MKLHFLLSLTLLTGLLLTNNAFAQTEEQRNKIQMVINSSGKVITTDLTSLSTSLSRMLYAESAPVLSADTSKAKTKVPLTTSNSFYLTMDAKQISTELLKVFSKKDTRFDGTITITDTYGKLPQRIIKFKQAAFYSYSDQFTSASYGDSYGNSIFSILCKEISINGVTIEQ